MIGHVVIDGLRVESPNKKLYRHWRKNHRQAKHEHRIVALVLRSELGRAKVAPSGQHVLLKRIGPRKLDDDNLRGALKAVRDEVAAFLGVDDGDARVQWEYAQGKGEPRQYAVIIAFEEAA